MKGKADGLEDVPWMAGEPTQSAESSEFKVKSMSNIKPKHDQTPRMPLAETASVAK